jgi:hypothetical protein
MEFTMIGSLRLCCPWKAFVVLGGVAVLSLAGGWKLWSLESSTEPVIPVAQTSALEQIAPPAQTPAPRVEANTNVPTPTERAAAEKDAVKPVDKAKKATGKDHDRQDKLLASVMQRLHADAYDHFISQPGQGISRLMPVVNVAKRDWKMPQWTSEELVKAQAPLKGEKDFELIHRLSLRKFGANGMAEKEYWENEHKNPLPPKERLWEIKALDLVGLIMHESPVVYISEKLPEMKNLKKTPTRDLDLFESEGLEELMAGKELYIRSQSETIRVLGPVKAGKACLKCHHDAKEGDVLGAFSYTLRPGQYVINGKSVPVERPQPKVNSLKNSPQP